MTNKNLVIIRTPELFMGLLDEYRKTLTKNHKTILVYQSTKNDFEQPEQNFYMENVNINNKIIDMFIIKPLTNDKLGLEFLTPEDSAMYTVASYFQDYDFYWNIEFNAYMNSDSYKHFFEEYEDNQADFLAANIKPDVKNDGQYTASQGVYRISNRCIKHLLDLRKKLDNDYSKSVNFFPTEICNSNQFSVEYIKNQNILEDACIDFAETRIYNTPDKKIYYPVE